MMTQGRAVVYGVPPCEANRIGPRLKYDLFARYPEIAQRSKLEGEVEVLATISADGEIEKIQIEKAAHPLLDRSAVDAVRDGVYVPATVSCVAVSDTIRIAFDFRLHGEKAAR